jgi:sec-independent protein translocase protein TatB
MFDVGFAELFLLALVGLLVLGPERLPGVARTVGGFVRKARASWVSLRTTIESELNEADISEPLKKATDEFKQIGQSLTDMPGFNVDKAEPKPAEAEPETTNDRVADNGGQSQGNGKTSDG